MMMTLSPGLYNIPCRVGIMISFLLTMAATRTLFFNLRLRSGMFRNFVDCPAMNSEGFRLPSMILYSVSTGLLHCVLQTP